LGGGARGGVGEEVSGGAKEEAPATAAEETFEKLSKKARRMKKPCMPRPNMQ